jgi:hypothetical protein
MKIQAIQQAHQCRGQNYYVTNEGIKRDYNLLGGKYEFKIYNNGKDVVVENFEGKIIEKIALSQELRDATDAKVSKPDKKKGNPVPAD